jgi:hypothetical protein
MNGTPTKGKPIKGQGKRQFFACYDRIQDLAGKGCNPLLIYEILTKEGLMTRLSYSCFYDHLTQRKRKRRLCLEQAKAVAAPVLQLSPIHHPARAESAQPAPRAESEPPAPAPQPDLTPPPPVPRSTWSLDARQAAIKAAQPGRISRAPESESETYKPDQVI